MCSPLFDAHLDLTLLSLSLLDSHTHRFLVATNLLHPPSPPPSLHTPIPTTTTTTCSLFVPHLRLPWSSALCSQLWRFFQIRLIPLDNAPLLTVEHFLSDIAHIDSPQFRKRACAFYPPLPARYRRSNQAVLTRLSRTHPNALSHLATCVKLAYANALCHALSEHTLHTTLHLHRLLHPSTTTTTTTTTTNNNNNNNNNNNKPPRPTSSSPSRPRPGAAETGRLPPPRPPLPHPPSPPTLPALPPFPKPLSRLSTVTIIAHALPRARTNLPARCLLHGVSVSARLLPTITALLSQYAINVITRRPTTAPPATLLNLSNRRFRDANASISHLRTPPTAARGPVALDDAVDAHVATWLALSWRQLCARVVARAQVVVREREIAEEVKRRERLEEAVGGLEEVRRLLIDRALRQELQGASLADMCAFTIAKWKRKEFECKVGKVADQFNRHVMWAEQRLGLLNSVELRNAGRLLAPAVLGR